MPSLYAYVDYAKYIHGWKPTGVDLVGFTQDNPMLDSHRQVLSEEFPRRKFETELQVTVGGLRADKGTYYRGRERADGLAKLAALQEARKLGLVNGQHLIQKTFDPDDHSRYEATFVSVEARFTRPAWGNAAGSSASLHAHGPFGDRHLGVLVAALWQTIQYLVDVAPVARAHAYWDSQQYEDLRPTEGDAPLAAFMFFDRQTVSALGGAERAAERLGAFAWRAVRDDENNGVVMQLGRRPEDTDDENMRRIRSRLSQ